MYSPAHYEVSEEKLLKEVIEQNPFATMISSGNELTVSHLPIYPESTYKNFTLSGHMARANDHWKKASGAEVTVIFHGPHAYISPKWYTESLSNVPTWNYVVVHATGTLVVIEDEVKALAALKAQVLRNEGQNGWKMPSQMQEIQRLFKAIVVFEITGVKLTGKFKLSQKQDLENKLSVITHLESGSEEARKTAAYMKRLSLS